MELPVGFDLLLKDVVLNGGALCIEFYAFPASYWKHAACESAFAPPGSAGGSNGEGNSRKDDLLNH